MIFNVVCSIIVVFFGGAVEIYTFSNVGYLASFIPVLIGYYLLRKHRPNLRRPFKLPEWMKYVALAARGDARGHLLLGGPVYASCACNRRRTQDAAVLLHRDRRRAAVPAAVLLAQARRQTHVEASTSASTGAPVSASASR